MAGRIVVSPMSEERDRVALPLVYVNNLLDAVEKPLIVAERSGNLLLVNSRATKFLETQGHTGSKGLNLFGDVLQADPKQDLQSDREWGTRGRIASRELAD